MVRFFPVSLSTNMEVNSTLKRNFSFGINSISFGILAGQRIQTIFVIGSESRMLNLTFNPDPDLWLIYMLFTFFALNKKKYIYISYYSNSVVL